MTTQSMLICPRQGGLLRGVLLAVLLANGARATDRLFTYSYEPETMPKGATEFEQWVTLRAGRTGDVGQENYNRWELREELEHGVTDLYTVGLYLNLKQTSYRDPMTSTDFSDFEFAGVSLENRYMVLNPAEHPVGLTLYLEPAYSGEEAEIETKIILGQRHGDWKWAVNLNHAVEWEDNFHETVGKLEGTIGVARSVGKGWAVGLELRSETEIAEYEKWDNTALFLGPVVSYRQEKWWAALTVMPQIWGRNFNGNPDNDTHFDLQSHERVNVRLLVGLNF